MNWHNRLAALAVIGCFMAPTVAPACMPASPAAQRAMARAQAEHGLAEIDKRLPAATLSDADLAKVKNLQTLARKLVAAGNAKKANDRIAEILKILGVPYGAVYGLPTRCGG